MKANLLSLVPSTLLTVLVAATAALRFYDATDFPPKLPPISLRDWSFWLFTATLVVALVDFGLRWWIGNLEAAEKERARATEVERIERETERVKRETERVKRQDRQNLALYAYIANPTEINRQRLEAICHEIEQTDLD